MIAGYAYEELLDFLLSSPTPEQIVTFTPSRLTRRRLDYLLLRKRAGALTAAEQAELDEFNRVEYLMRRLMSRARRRLSVEY